MTPSTNGTFKVVGILLVDCWLETIVFYMTELLVFHTLWYLSFFLWGFKFYDHIHKFLTLQISLSLLAGMSSTKKSGYGSLVVALGQQKG